MARTNERHKTVPFLGALRVRPSSFTTTASVPGQVSCVEIRNSKKLSLSTDVLSDARSEESPGRVVIGIGGLVLSYNRSKANLPPPAQDCRFHALIDSGDQVDESHHVGLIVGTFPHRNAELTGCRRLLTRYYSFLY
jgi:hypothetical protein